jgi:hypothetical protein
VHRRRSWEIFWLTGVPTELHVSPGGFHGFDIMVPEAAISKQFTAAWNDALNRTLTDSAQDVPTVSA